MNAITVVQKGDKYVAKFRFDFETKDRIKAAGFRFDGAAKEWWTADAAIAAKLDGAIATLNPVMPANGWPDPLPATVIPAPDGLEYLPYQKAGIEQLILRKDALLADQMGLGKTIQAIGLINIKPDIRRVLIVCPASLKINWKLELMRWLVRPATLNIIDPGSQWLDTDIVIINYEQVALHRHDIMQTDWDLLICDESHYLKNPKAKRTHVVLGLWDDDPAKRIYPIKAKQRLLMTGTPVLNRPKELWTTVRALDRTGLGSDWHAFHTRYCAAFKDRFGWQLDGASNLSELQSKLRASIMIRRRKEDVLKELPPKRRQIIMLEPVTIGAKQALKAETELKETEDKIAALRAEVESLSVNQADAKYKAAVQKLSSYENLAFGDTARVRHNTALAKLPMVMDHLVNILESEDKIVVFAHHQDVIAGLAEGLAEHGVRVVNGPVAMLDRQAAVEAFQKDPKVRVIIGSIGAMGIGWTLTAASYVAFAELDWVPGNLSQAEDRLHRIGQAESVLVQHLMLNGSFDGRMAKSVVHKQAVIERATG